jgi:hypothetical protein
MDTQALPIVSFGKYKDKSVLELIADVKYTEWLKQQSWFSNHKLYNIVVHQTIQTSNNSKTPEHNKLQNLFLDKNNQIKLMNKLFGNNIGTTFKKKFEKLIKDEKFINYFDSSTLMISSTKDETYNKINEKSSEWVIPEFKRNALYSNIVFEAKYNWDFKLSFNDYHEVIFQTKNDVKEKELEDIMKVYDFKIRFNDKPRVLGTFIYKNNEKYDVNISAVHNERYLFCELKPTLSDDYPCVLRKLTTQIELTKNSKEYEAEPRSNMFYILIIGSFTSETTSKEQLIEIFKQSNIHIIFTDEIFEISKSHAINSSSDNADTNCLLFENKLIEENKGLKDNLFQTQQKLLQAEDKVKQLQEEIVSLKLKNKSTMN